MLNNVMSNQAQCVTAALATAGVVGGAYYAYKVYKEKARIPKEWTQVGTVSHIYVYPIKSCGSVLKDKIEISLLGPRDGWLRDRALMVTDENFKFTTARIHPELLLIKPTIRNTVLTLEFKNMEPVHVNLAEVASLEKPRQGNVWGDSVPVYDCGSQVAEWITRVIGDKTKTFRLAYYASSKPRGNKETESDVFRFTKKDTGMFPDEVSYNAINESTVDDLNRRLLDCEVSHRVFRPNFVIKGAQPYDEDNWRFLKIGDHIFEIIKPCTRCVMTTIDPETGVRDPKTEPLETLKSYRQVTNPRERKSVGSSPRMGVQMALRSAAGGHVALNDPVYIA